MNLVSKLNLRQLNSDLDDSLNQQLKEARREWQEAKIYFDSVCDPDLVDHAIYLLEAAEKKYTYLLKKKKIENKK